MKKQPRLKAHLIVKGATQALLDGPIPADRIEEFTPPAENIERTLKCMRRLGFEAKFSGIAITITGTLYRFNKVFQLNITESTEISTATAVIPPTLSDLIEAVAFPQPTSVHRQGCCHHYA